MKKLIFGIMFLALLLLGVWLMWLWANREPQIEDKFTPAEPEVSQPLPTPPPGGWDGK